MSEYIVTGCDCVSNAKVYGLDESIRRANCSYSNVMDWCIDIYGYERDEMPFISCQSCDVELVFAKAQVELKEWLAEHRGGY